MRFHGQDLGEDLVPGTELGRATFCHDKEEIDAGQGARPMGDDNSNPAALSHPFNRLVKAASPSASRLEFGSSRTTRKGSP